MRQAGGHGGENSTPCDSGTMTENVAMDGYYCRQIRLPFRHKAQLIHALMRFIVAQPGAAPREAALFKRFVEESSDPFCLTEQVADPWFAEHVARLFWVCCELGLLKYQYPYPHRGQTYLPTCAGRMVAHTPWSPATTFVAIAYIVAIAADPVKRFNRVRNIVTVVTGMLLWWRHHELSSLVVAASIAAGIVSKESASPPGDAVRVFFASRDSIVRLAVNLDRPLGKLEADCDPRTDERRRVGNLRPCADDAFLTWRASTSEPSAQTGRHTLDLPDRSAAA
jgi:hypothetical protein